jgi:hypothetical protein
VRQQDLLRCPIAHDWVLSPSLDNKPNGAEAYTLKDALDGWILNESNEQIRTRAAAAYAKYQKCSLNAARRLMATGW